MYPKFISQYEKLCNKLGNSQNLNICTWLSHVLQAMQKKQSQKPLLQEPVKPSNICRLFVLNETASLRKEVNISEGH